MSSKKQCHRRREIDHDSGGQQASSALDGPGFRQDFVDEIAVDNSGEHAETDTIGQPVVATAFLT
ncbi:hypothetical protein P3H15_37395 [Rhodococcus sp. T2V]|nr:hypothetical protein [Rhodococcus sp. T2V]MDF3310691.1 hypothetical protein [Rhodococcus sp. T2V]